MMFYNTYVSKYVLVATLTNIPNLLVYKLKEKHIQNAHVGKIVLVPIKSRYYKGVITELFEELPENCKNFEIEEIYDMPPLPQLFDEQLLQFYKFAANYYSVPLGVVLKSAFPDLGGITVKERLHIKDFEEQVKKFFPKLTLKEIKRFEELGIIHRETEISLKNQTDTKINYLDIRDEKKISLTEEQIAIKNDVISGLGRYMRHLFFGKTGSGKTELLLNIVEEVINRGYSVLYLVPEISLVPVIYKRATSVISKEQIFVWHSSINKNQRWQAMLSFNNRPSLLIGTRSAVFLPFKNVGLIIVDEEHDGSYKNEGQFPYNSRDMAIMRAKMLSHPVILSSATPSIESYHNACKEKATLHCLTQTFSPRRPEIIIVNTKEEEIIDGFFSRPLLGSIKQNLEKGEQSLIFINRRGYIPYIYCDGCKRFIECRDCTVPLTWHKKKNLLSCHRCGKTYKPLNTCTACGNPRLSFFGAGTERIAELLKNHFPEANLLKIDRDDTEKAGFLKKHLVSILDGTYNLLVATQIMAKGYHMPKLTLVGVLLGEQGLSIPDFRAQEKSFQILLQVFGRSGREKEGKVIIQTNYVDAPSINYAVNDDYEGFYNYELELRRAALFPPFVRLLIIKIASKSEEETANIANHIFQNISHSGKKELVCYPPQPAPIYREAGKYRYQIYVKSKSYQSLTGLVKRLRMEIKKGSDVRIYYDIDPYNTM